MRQSRCIAVLLALTVWSARPHAEDPPSRDELLARASGFAERFGAELQGVVARERYTQTIRSWMGSPPALPAEVPALDTRRLVSSLLLVHDAATPWQLHRDVLTVDDVPVVGREARLAQLFADPRVDARQRLRQITEESARYNLGHVTRNINVPTFPLLVVHPAYRERFRFRDRGRTREDGVEVRLLAYEEKGRPRVVRGDRHRDVVLEGVLVIDEASGELVRATVRPRAGDLRSRLEVWFGRVEGLPMRVPVRFWEWYWVHDVPERDRYIEGEASYDEFRRYVVDVRTPGVP
jgi:hypothetical protein